MRRGCCFAMLAYAHISEQNTLRVVPDCHFKTDLVGLVAISCVQLLDAKLPLDAVLKFLQGELCFV